MDGFECEECRAIYQELQRATQAVRQHQSGHGNTSTELASYLEQLEVEECTRTRETSPLWKAWRRLREHRSLTGHSISVVADPAERHYEPELKSWRSVPLFVGSGVSHAE